MTKKEIQINEADEAVEGEGILDLSKQFGRVEKVNPDKDKAYREDSVLDDVVNEALITAAAAEQAFRDARDAWNRVFFRIRDLKPGMKDSRALRESKLGALLDKLP